MSKIWWVPVLVWALIWLQGARAFHGDVDGRTEHVAYLAQPLTPLAPGPARLEGRVVGSSAVTSPLGGEECVAAYVAYGVRTSTTDVNGKLVYYDYSVEPLRVGPERIEVATESGTVELYLRDFEPDWGSFEGSTAYVHELPSPLVIAPEVQEAILADASGSHWGYSVSERVLTADLELFLVGTLDDQMRLGPDPQLGQIGVYKGDQAAAVALAQTQVAVNRAAVWIFFALGLAPIVVLLLLQLRAWRIARMPPSLRPSHTDADRLRLTLYVEESGRHRGMVWTVHAFIALMWSMLLLSGAVLLFLARDVEVPRAGLALISGAFVIGHGVELLWLRRISSAIGPLRASVSIGPRELLVGARVLPWSAIRGAVRGDDGDSVSVLTAQDTIVLHRKDAEPELFGRVYETLTTLIEAFHGGDAAQAERQAREAVERLTGRAREA